MNVWDKDRFSELESRVIATLDKKRPAMDVPYYRYLYNPEQEIICLREFNKLCSILKVKGYSAECIYLSELVIASLEKLGFLSKIAQETERSNFSIIEENLERELTKEIVDGLKRRLSGKGISHCAILLRAGSLFPFVHISTILSQLEGQVKCTIVLPYPGTKDGEMLNYREEKIRSYYRGEVI